jgi:hypothetical protein
MKDRLPSNAITPEDLISTLPGTPGFYLDLRMMIQNRTKEPKLIFAKDIVAVMRENERGAFLEGRKPGENHLPCQVISG